MVLRPLDFDNTLSPVPECNISEIDRHVELSMNKTIHFYVSGRVQGVFFRMRARQQAEQLGVTGWVRNLMDGRVEGTASGDSSQLQHFREWLHRGPEYARVEAVEVEELDYEEFPDFRVR